MSLLKAVNITKSFRNGESNIEVLKKLNLEVNSNEFISIMGRSGSGKSTLLSILGGLDVPDQGAVILDGIAVHELDEAGQCRLRREKIGYIFQAYNLIPVLNVKENIELPQLERDETYVDRLLSILELSDKKDSFPGQLSGGQQQRVAIARALVNKPSIVLADEPTGNLDIESENIVIDTFRKLVSECNTTIIIVTHSEEVAGKTDRIIYLKDGGVQ